MMATSINPIDWKLRRGDLKSLMPLQFPAVLGRDLAGEVVELARFMHENFRGGLRRNEIAAMLRLAA
jgi:NADPH:quinone reductase-like Zn-dependent oxidoreductase